MTTTSRLTAADRKAYDRIMKRLADEPKLLDDYDTRFMRGSMAFALEGGALTDKQMDQWRKVCAIAGEKPNQVPLYRNSDRNAKTRNDFDIRVAAASIAEDMADISRRMKELAARIGELT